MLRLVLIAALVAALGFLASINLPRLGGRYMLRDGDHADIMTSGVSARTTRTVSILFIGNSFTFTNDLPAMVVNLAAADQGNTTQLAVKAITVPDARLGALLQQSGATPWARAHHLDFIVLQEHSGWYAHPQWIQDARQAATTWRDVARGIGAVPVLFEPWADGRGSNIYTDPGFYAYGKSPADEAHDSERGSAALAQELGLSLVAVGRAFRLANGMAGAPDLYQADRHHPSVAGTYLAALTFYRAFTGRTGAESSYRPWGVSAADAALLVKASGG